MQELRDPPLAATLARVCAREEVLRIRLGRSEGSAWFSPTELVDPASPSLDLVLSRAEARFGADRQVAAALFFHVYVWSVAASAICCYVVEQRAPDVGSDNILVGFDDRGQALGVALLAPRFAALPDDPEKGHNDVALVANDDELGAWLHANVVEDNVAALARAIRTRRILGWPILAGIVSDTCADVFVRAGRIVGDPNRALATGTAFLNRPGFSDSQAGTLFLREHKSGRRLFYRRATCCLVYRTPQGKYCDNCPLLAEEERERRLVASLEQG